MEVCVVSYSDHSYAGRLLLMSAARHDPTRDLDGATLCRWNYETRKAALFAFFASTSERNMDSLGFG